MTELQISFDVLSLPFSSRPLRSGRATPLSPGRLSSWQPALFLPLQAGFSHELLDSLQNLVPRARHDVTDVMQRADKAVGAAASARGGRAYPRAEKFSVRMPG
jgi:hypothetical protein